MRRLVLGAVSILVAAGTARAQRAVEAPDAQEIKEYILFSEIVRVAAPGRGQDISFAQGNAGQVKPDDVVWVLGPQETNLQGVASRPIRDTAKAGEPLGRLGGDAWRDGAAVHVRGGQDGAYVLDHAGRLWLWRSGRADSVRIGQGLPTAADVDGNSSGLIAVLWGHEVAVCLGFPSAPMWRFPLEDDILPAVGVAVSAAGEVFVAGRGSVAVGVYDLDADGAYRRTRSATAAALGVQAAGGVEVPPFMILPTEGKEAYVDPDRFVLVSDADAGTLLVLERSSLVPVGRWDVRGQIAGAAPGRFDVSNRGQIAFVDVRSGEAQVLPTRVLAAMIEPVGNIRWRNLDPSRQVFRVQGGDTLQIPAPRH